jgi:hypothetical protein
LIRRAGCWGCVFGLLVMHSFSSGFDGFGPSQLRFMVAESPAETATPGDPSSSRESPGNSSVLLPNAKLPPGEPEPLPSPPPEESPATATDRVPYRIVPICRLQADISQPEAAKRTGVPSDKRDYAAEAFADRPVIDARGNIGWQPLSYTPLGPAATFCHPPAYFAEPGLERYGRSRWLQPCWSGAHFYGKVLALPAMWTVRPPWNHVCRDPMTDPAGFDATAEFFQPPTVRIDGPRDATP